MCWANVGYKWNLSQIDLLEQNEILKEVRQAGEAKLIKYPSLHLSHVILSSQLVLCFLSVRWRKTKWTARDNTSWRGNENLSWFVLLIDDYMV